MRVLNLVRGAWSRPRSRIGTVAELLIVATWVVGAAPATAQRASENAVTAAEDAFGVSVGNETLGLYTSDNVRGFSALDAGNVRLDGIYFDPVSSPSPRLVKSSTIRVGISAQGFAFPAPTGVVDYALRRPGDEPSASAFASIDTYGFAVAELDATVPLVTDSLALDVGGGRYHESYYNGTTDNIIREAAVLRWRPGKQFELLPFWSRSDVYDSEAPPLYITGGEYLPPHIARDKFNGPNWAQNRIVRSTYGAISRWIPDDNWLLEAGAFRSESNVREGFTNLFLNLTHDGHADQVVIADPPARNASTSGELRITRAFSDGPRQHNLLVTLRGRERERLYDGSDVIDLGDISLGERQTAPRQVLAFTTLDRDRIQQGTAGLAYEGRWKNVGELTVSLQKTDYTKRVWLANLSADEIRAAPLLYSAAAAAHMTSAISLYASYTTGLEDSGSAPGSAINRNEPLPASLTRQEDAGVRWALTDKLKLIASAFEVRKPYFQLDAVNRYTLLGSIDNRGVELSATGAVTPRLDIVAGAVLSDPRVSGDGVRLGLVGREPVDQPGVRIDANVDWRPTVLNNVSFDLSVSYLGRRAATIDDAVHVPARTLVDVGARYAFKLAAKPAQLRLSITNLGDVYGFDLSGAGVYDTISGRAAQLSLGVDM